METKNRSAMRRGGLLTTWECWLRLPQQQAVPVTAQVKSRGAEHDLICHWLEASEFSLSNCRLTGGVLLDEYNYADSRCREFGFYGA
jgi:hypothetical protein